MKKALLTAALCTIGSFCSAADYNFVSIKGLIEQDVGRVVLPKVYEKLGLTIDIEPMAGKRAQSEATSGRKDGEIMRIHTYGKENPTTIRVETPYYYLETMAFVRKDSGIKIDSKEDLKKYKLIKVSGVKHTNNITAGIDGVKDVTSTEQMMQLLQTGRYEVALTNTVDGNLVLKKLGMTDEIGPIEKPLAVLDLYTYIHEKNADLVTKVNDMIQSLKDSGELAEIIKAAEDEVINSQL